MEIIKLVISSAGLFAFLIAIVQLVKTGIDSKRVKQAAKIEQESTDQRDDRRTDAQWNAQYRSRAEIHLSYDSARRSQIYRLQDQVNDERERDGPPRPPIQWPDLPEAPSLFPPPTA